MELKLSYNYFLISTPFSSVTLNLPVLFWVLRLAVSFWSRAVRVSHHHLESFGGIWCSFWWFLLPHSRIQTSKICFFFHGSTVIWIYYIRRLLQILDTSSVFSLLMLELIYPASSLHFFNCPSVSYSQLWDLQHQAVLWPSSPHTCALLHPTLYYTRSVFPYTSSLH